MGPGRAQDRTQARVWMAPPRDSNRLPGLSDLRKAHRHGFIKFWGVGGRGPTSAAMSLDHAGHCEGQGEYGNCPRGDADVEAATSFLESEKPRRPPDTLT